MHRDASNLLLEIARCPNLLQCYDTTINNHPCSNIVSTQNNLLDVFHLPEPWNGEIESAPILFISSNPSININEVYPTTSWPDNEIIDFFSNRFGGNWVDIQNYRYYPKLKDGTYSKGNVFWGKVRNHSEKLLQRNVIAGIDFALTEVVHCKSVKEIGVQEAITECIKYLPQILNMSGANIIIILGKKAELMVKDYLGISGSEDRFFTKNNRNWVFVDHSCTPYVLLDKVLTPGELKLLQNSL